MRGFVLTCDRAGAIQRVVRLDLGYHGQKNNPVSLFELADEASREKIRHFLNAVSNDGVAYRWEVNVLLDDTIVVFPIAGYLEDGKVVVMGAEDPPLLLSLIEEMSAINNEYANLLRLKVRDATPMAPPMTQALHGAAAALDEMSALNNELVAMSRRLERTNHDLKASIRERNHWIGIIAHDLRNPLGVISAYAELLGMSLGSQIDARTAGILNSIRASSTYMQSLVNQYIDLSAVETGHLVLNCEPTDLVPLLDRCMALNGVLAERKGIRLALTEAPRTAVRTIDAVKIEQVLNNLIGNAIKYTPEGGRIGVDLKDTNEALLIGVHDTGPGIEPKDIERIFKPFQVGTAKPTGGEAANGLGLAICKRIVEGHGGKIMVRSTPGEGSSFVIALPFDGT